MPTLLRSPLLYIVGLLGCVLAGPVHGEGRIPWTTSRVSGSPEPPLPYTVERIFPEVSFREPVDFAVEPTTGRWFVLQLDGKLFAFDPKTGKPPTLLADMKSHVPGHVHSYGIEFHPDYSRNRQLFWCYVLQAYISDGSKVVRLQVPAGDSPVVDVSRQDLVIAWPSGGHNGGCIKFGPDGMLYITTGDGTGPFPPDGADAGQNLADLRSTIMRIDVDRPAEGRGYAVPEDNPFVSTPNARPEIWAFGFRNPWKISFDSQTGELWCGDVGWELWEMVFRIVRGGNYGWSLMEGRQPVRVDLPQGPGEIIPPVVDHLHTEARSITGGYVYHGQILPELQGAYLYGDWVTGKIWGLRNEGNRPVWQQELADSSLAIVTFGLDADGELVVVDYAGGLYRLVPRRSDPSAAEFPRQLSRTGLFESLDGRVPAPGVIRYELNAEMFADGAIADRLLGIPGEGTIQVTRDREHWKYPKDTVLAKTLSLPDGTRSRPVETQMLHFDGDEWRAYSYLWNDEQTDAELVEKEGRDLKIRLADGSNVPWRIHSRAECLSCHMPPAGFTIGISLANLHRPHPIGTGSESQLVRFQRWNVFAGEIPQNELKRPMVDPFDQTADLQDRARSWLAINCAHCHRRQGGGTARIEFPFEHRNDQLNAIGELPTQGAFGIADGRIISPGRPARSILYYRLTTVGRGHMPHLGGHQVDELGLSLIRDWIVSLNPDTRGEDPDPESLAKVLEPATRERLFADTSLAMAFAERLTKQGDRVQASELAASLAEQSPPHLRGLFERFVPIERRQARLGTTVDVSDILVRSGDPAAGERLFHHAEGVTCRNCHQIRGQGKNVGPDLSKLGKQRTREQMLESILLPSKTIDPKYVNYVIETKDGRVVTGLITERSADHLVIRDATAQEIRLAFAEIDVSIPQSKSLMPDLLVKDLTADDLADLLAYLMSLQE